MTELTDREEMLEALHHLLNKLPALNYAVFERLIFHLARSVIAHLSDGFHCYKIVYTAHIASLSAFLAGKLLTTWAD